MLTKKDRASKPEMKFYSKTIRFFTNNDENFSPNKDINFSLKRTEILLKMARNNI
jgi:hypothetical protein